MSTRPSATFLARPCRRRPGRRRRRPARRACRPAPWAPPPRCMLGDRHRERVGGALGASSQSPKRTSTRTTAPPFDWYCTSTARARPSARSISAAVSLLPAPSGSVASARAQLGRRAAARRPPLGARARQVDAGHAQVGGRAARRRRSSRPPSRSSTPAARLARARRRRGARARRAERAPAERRPAPRTARAPRALLPLDRRGRLRRDVVDHAVDAAHLVDDARRDRRRAGRTAAAPSRRSCRRCECTARSASVVRVGALVAHHADRLRTGSSTPNDCQIDS